MSAQVMVVDLESALGSIEPLFAEEKVSLHLVDDLEEAMEMAGITGVDMLLVNVSQGAFDPVDVVATSYAEGGLDNPPFVFMEPKDLSKTRIVRRGGPKGEFAVSQPARGELGQVLRALLSAEGLPFSIRLERGDIRDQILEIGYNDEVDVEDARYCIQTEVHPTDGSLVIRSKVFREGQITLLRNFTVELGVDPLAATERLTNDIHRETCVSVVLKLAKGDV